MIPLMTNTRKSYLHANPSESEIDDLFAWQSATKKLQQDLEAKGIPKTAEEYNLETIYQPSYARVVYDVDNAATEITENVLDGIAWYKMKQRMYVDVELYDAKTAFAVAVDDDAGYQKARYHKKNINPNESAMHMVRKKMK